MIAKKEGKVITLAQAITLSNEVLDIMKPFIIMGSVVGLVRRERLRPIDNISFVFVPKLVTESTDLFFDDCPRVEGFVNTINKWERVWGDPDNGKYTQRMHGSGVKINIYMGTETNFGFLQMRNTGPEIFVYRVNDQIKKAGYFTLGGYVFRCGTNKIIQVRTEKELFDLIGMPYIIPPVRI